MFMSSSIILKLFSLRERGRVFVTLQPICRDQSVPEGHDSSDPHSICPGTVPARPAG